MGIAGMILGIIGLVFSLIPFFGAFVAIPCVGVGLPLSGVAFQQARKAEVPLGVPIAGLATNAVALAITIAWIVLFIVGFASYWWDSSPSY